MSVLIYTSTFIFYFHWLIKLIGCMIESHSADFIPLWVFSKNLLITSYCIVDLELFNIYIVPLLRPLRFLVVVCDKITNSNTEQ